MLYMFVVGKITNDVIVKTDEETGDRTAVLRVVSLRDYKNRGGEYPADFISVKVRNKNADYCAKYASKGNWIIARGDFETVIVDEETRRRPGFMVKAERVKLLSLHPKEKETPDLAEQEAEAAKAVGQALTEILSSVEPEVA